MINEKSGNGFVTIGLVGHSEIDFLMPRIRKGLTVAGKLTKQEARRLVARRAISGAGEFPGQDTGKLMRSIKIISRGRNWVKVGPTKTSGMDAFYPAFLFYGITGKANKRNLAPRGNYMTEALRLKRQEIRAIIRSSLLDALKPR